MVFQASNVRERRAPEPVGTGKPLTPSAATRLWYQKQMASVVSAMMADYKKQLTEARENPEVQLFYAEDDANSVYTRIMKALNKKWASIFLGFANQVAPEFVDKVNVHSKSSTWMSMTTAGIEQPRQAYTDAVNNTLKSSIEYNHTLITSIQKETHEDMFSAIMLSLTSPNPEEQGSSGIANALRKVGITNRNRVDLIARDQTSKVYASLSTERLRQGGVEYFRWLHSSAGKEPRESHERMNNEVFMVDDPILWEVGGPYGLKKGDLGPPGWAINCRCRMVPLIGYNDEDDDE